MNNYPSSNFSTVLLLVVLFIVMGALIYHTIEVTLDNNQLRETVTTLDKENQVLKIEKAALVDENTKMKTALEQALAENSSLKTMYAGANTELVTLQAQCNGNESSSAGLQALQSSIIPTDLGLWMKLVAIGLVAAVLPVRFTINALQNRSHRKRASILNPIYDGIPRKNQYTNVIDSRFVKK